MRAYQQQMSYVNLNDEVEEVYADFNRNQPASSQKAYIPDSFINQTIDS